MELDEFWLSPICEGCKLIRTTVIRDLGYSAHDIISTMFKVTKTIPTLSEHSKLEFIKEIGFTHMRILEGLQTLVQLSGCIAKLCKINMKPELFVPSKSR